MLNCDDSTLPLKKLCPSLSLSLCLLRLELITVRIHTVHPLRLPRNPATHQILRAPSPLQGCRTARVLARVWCRVLDRIRRFRTHTRARSANLVDISATGGLGGAGGAARRGSDRHVFAENCAATGVFNEVEWGVYRDWHDWALR